MKKILLSSPQFTGEVYLLYNEDGALNLVDFQETDLDSFKIDYFIKRVPASFESVEAILKALNSRTLSAIEADFTVSFEEWWKDYDNPIHKQRCLKIWNRMTKVDQVKAYVGNRPYRRHLQLNPWKNKLLPETYLNGRCWENEYK